MPRSMTRSRIRRCMPLALIDASPSLRQGSTRATLPVSVAVELVRVNANLLDPHGFLVAGEIPAVECVAGQVRQGRDR